jgi:hypothetical protein
MSVYVPEVQHIPVDELEPSSWNPNELKGEDFDRLVQEIEEVGFIDFPQVVPIVDGSYRIIGGQHRWMAAKALSMDKVPCLVLSDKRWQEADLQKFATVRLNMLRGQQNPEKMVALYREMGKKYGDKALRRMFAYTDHDAWKKLVKQVKKGIKQAGLPQNIQKKFGEQADGAANASDLGTILNHLMNEYGDTLDFSFMVFAFGGKEHLYVAMSKKTKKVMDRIVEVCKSWEVDMNEVIAEVTEKWLDAAEQREADEVESETD